MPAAVDADLLERCGLARAPEDLSTHLGLSAFVARALRREFDRVNLREFLDELAVELGPPDETMVAEADDLLAALPPVRGRRSREEP